MLRAEDLARVQALVGDPEAAIDLLDDLLTRPGSGAAALVERATGR